MLFSIAQSQTQGVTTSLKPSARAVGIGVGEVGSTMRSPLDWLIAKPMTSSRGLGPGGVLLPKELRSRKSSSRSSHALRRSL